MSRRDKRLATKAEIDAADLAAERRVTTEEQHENLVLRMELMIAKLDLAIEILRDRP